MINWELGDFNFARGCQILGLAKVATIDFIVYTNYVILRTKCNSLFEGDIRLTLFIWEGGAGFVARKGQMRRVTLIISR